MKSCFLLFQNYIESEFVVGTTISSQDPSYPYSNTLDKYRRLKKWRSQGYWKVEAGKNTLVFRETAGVDLVATIAPGEYTSSSAFCQAIKTALEAPGAYTYQVQVASGTKKISIGAPSAGGIFQIMATDPQSHDFCELIGFSKTYDRTGALTYTADLIRINSGEHFIWDLGFASNPKAFVLSVAANKFLNLSPTAKIYLQANETNVWTNPSFSKELTFSLNQIGLASASGIADQGYRFWKLLIEDRVNADGYLELNSLYLGDAFAPKKGAAQFPFVFEYNDRSTVIYSENGVPSGLDKTKTQKFTINWDFLSFNDKEQFEAIYAKFGKTRPFYVMFDGLGAFTSGTDFSIRYCLFSREPSFDLTNPNIFSSRMELLESI